MHNKSVADGNPKYATSDSILTNADKTSIYWYLEARTGYFTTPACINTIENGAFLRSNLTSQTISKDVNNIHNTTFTLAGSLRIYNGTATSIALGKGNYMVRIGNMVQKVQI